MATPAVAQSICRDVLENEEPVLVDIHQNDLSYIHRRLSRSKSGVIYLSDKDDDGSSVVEDVDAGGDKKRWGGRLRRLVGRKKRKWWVKVSMWDEAEGILRFEGVLK